jgi:hypothetical protein
MATEKKEKKNSPRRGTKSAAASHRAAEKAPCRVYALKVYLISGFVSDKFAKKNPSVYRTIQVRGDQTLEELHYTIFDAFDRFDEHLYEFQFGKKPMDRSAPRYGVSEFADPYDGMAGGVEETTIESLGLKVRRSFFYWFDFGDDWWHRIEVVAIDEKVPAGKLPKVIERVGESPPQYLDEEDDGDF